MIVEKYLNQIALLGLTEESQLIKVAQNKEIQLKNKIKSCDESIKLKQTQISQLKKEITQAKKDLAQNEANFKRELEKQIWKV